MRVAPILRGGGVLKTIGLLEGGYNIGTTVNTNTTEIPTGGPLSGRKAIMIQNQHGSYNLFIASPKPVNYLNKDYEWTPSASGTNEWYLQLKDSGGDPSFTEPDKVYTSTSGGFDGGTETEATEGTLGSMTEGQFDWGDNDSLTYDTIYVCTDGGVPFEYFDVIYGYTRMPATSGSNVGYRIGAGLSIIIELSGNTRIFAIASTASILVSTTEYE